MRPAKCGVWTRLALPRKKCECAEVEGGNAVAAGRSTAIWKNLAVEDAMRWNIVNARRPLTSGNRLVAVVNAFSEHGPAVVPVGDRRRRAGGRWGRVCVLGSGGDGSDPPRRAVRLGPVVRDRSRGGGVDLRSSGARRGRSEAVAVAPAPVASSGLVDERSLRGLRTNAFGKLGSRRGTDPPRGRVPVLAIRTRGSRGSLIKSSGTQEPLPARGATRKVRGP